MEEDTRLYLLNTTNQSSYTREEEFIRLVINVEAEKPSTDLFWFLFEVVCDLYKIREGFKRIILSEAYSFKHSYVHFARRCNIINNLHNELNYQLDIFWMDTH
jgi:hypothetical protein